MGFISWLSGNKWTPEPPRAKKDYGRNYKI